MNDNELKFDYSKLKGKIIEKYGNQGKFAKALGVTNSRLSRFLHNKSDLNLYIIRQAISLLQIPENQIGDYFFSYSVAKQQHL